MKPRPTDLILVRGKDWISHTIEEVQNCPYSHVSGVVKNNELIEAQGFKPTGYQALDAYKGFADVYRCESMTSEQRESILHSATWSVGGRYDYLLLFIELIRYWFGVLVPYKEPPNVRICSVLWAGIYRDAGIDLCPGIRYPTPKDISESKLLRKVGSL